MADVRLSVIIPVWNGRAFLPKCLDTLVAQADAVHEIIAVDNGSTDGSAGLIADRYGQVRLFRNAQNLGFAHACNVGMRAATGDIYVLLNQDTQVEPGWAAALQTAFADPDAGIIGCRILSAADRSLQHAGGRVHEVLGTPFHLGKESAGEGAWDAPHEVEYVTGAAMAIHRRVVEQIGLLDERFFPAYYEDVDLCFRARAAGFKVLYRPEPVVLHHESASTPDRTRWFYFQRGRIRFVLKHWPMDRLMEQFAEAEAGFQATFAREFGSTRPLRLAYTAARLEAPAIAAERWPGGRDELMQISHMLGQLHTRALTVEFARAGGIHELTWPTASGPGMAIGPLAEVGPESPGLLAPPLEEFEFRSAVPIVGGLIAALRRTWYAAAAKWAVRHLMYQQQAINRSIVWSLERLERQVAALIARQEAVNLELQQRLAEQERHAAAANRFFLDAISEAEAEAVFALLWPLRWDLVLDSGFSRGNPDG